MITIFNLIGGFGRKFQSRFVHTTVTVSSNPVNIFAYIPAGINLMTKVPLLLSYGGDGTDNNATTIVSGAAMSTGDNLTYTLSPSLGGNRVIAKTVVIKVNGTAAAYGQWGGSITGTGITTGTVGSQSSGSPSMSVTFSSSQSGNTITMDYTHSAAFVEGAPFYMNAGDTFDDRGIVCFVQNRSNDADLAAGYFDEVVKYFWMNYDLDPNRISYTGLSRGGRQVLNGGVSIDITHRYKFWITNVDGVIVTSDPSDAVNYTESGICALTGMTWQSGGTYTYANYNGIGVAGVMGTNDSGFGSVQNPNISLASNFGGTTLIEYPLLLNIWNGTHSASVWHNEGYNRKYRVGGSGVAGWDYIDFHWKFSRDLEACATLFVEQAEKKRGVEVDQIIDYRHAVRKVAQLGSGAVKTALLARLVTLKTALDATIVWRTVIAHSNGSISPSETGYNVITNHASSQSTGTLVDDNGTTLTGISWAVGTNPLGSGYQAELSSNRGVNNAGGFPVNVNRVGMKIGTTACPVGFTGQPSGTYTLRIWVNEGSGGFSQKEFTATINGVTRTVFIQGNSLQGSTTSNGGYAEWTGLSSSDVGSYSMGRNTADIYVTATELIRTA